MEDEIKKIKRTQLRILFTMSEILCHVKTDDIEKVNNKINNISNDINLIEGSDDDLKIKNLEMHNESLTNRIRMLEEDFERLKKAQLKKYFEYSTEYDSTDSE